MSDILPGGDGDHQLALHILWVRLECSCGWFSLCWSCWSLYKNGRKLTHLVPLVGRGSPLLWVYHRLRGREKLEQSKTYWRLGLGNLLNGPICPLCLPECHNAESGADDSRRLPFPSFPSPTVAQNPYPPLLFTLYSFLSGFLALTPKLL